MPNMQPQIDCTLEEDEVYEVFSCLVKVGLASPNAVS